MSGSVPGLDRDSGLARLLAAARRSLERNGGSLESAVSIQAPTDAERRTIIGITGIHRSAAAGRLVVRLADLDAYLVHAHGSGLAEILAAVDGNPLRNRPAERRHEAAAREAALASALGCAHRNERWFSDWLDAIARDGTLTKVVRGGGDLSSVARALDALPAADEPMPVFAERVLADTKALTDPGLRGLLLRAIASWQQTAIATTAEQERSLWESVGVVPDDLASQVLVLNLPAAGGLVGGWLMQAADAGVPVRLTLHQLRLSPLAVRADEVFVTENPAVLRAACALGRRTAPIVCTEGVPSAAAHRLLSYAGAATLWWRNDFDWPGVRMTAAALARYPTARPWRMTAGDYLAMVGSGPVLSGPPATTPWDPTLATQMHAAGRAVMEERLLPKLLDDLARGG